MACAFWTCSSMPAPLRFSVEAQWVLCPSVGGQQLWLSDSLLSFMCSGACTVFHVTEHLGHWESPDTLGLTTDPVAFDIYP